MISLFRGSQINKLFVLNLIFFLVINTLIFFIGNSSLNQMLINLGSINSESFVQFRFWDFILANFIHVEVWHIIFNMFAFFQLTKLIKDFIEEEKVIFIIYIFSGISSSIMTVIYYTSLLQSQFIGIGASGSVFGLLGFLLGINIFYKLKNVPTPMSINNFSAGLVFTTIFLILGFQNINHAAHFGGFIAGSFLGFIYPSFRFEVKIINIIYIFLNFLLVLSLFAVSIRFVYLIFYS